MPSYSVIKDVNVRKTKKKNILVSCKIKRAASTSTFRLIVTKRFKLLCSSCFFTIERIVGTIHRVRKEFVERLIRRRRGRMEV